MNEREKAHIEELLNAGAAELAERMKSTGSPTMIPAEAVEAAFQSVWGPNNSDPSNPADAYLLKQLRTALEAAAPYMLAEAWEQGYEAADYDAPHSIKTDNPYRTSK